MSGGKPRDEEWFRTLYSLWQRRVAYRITRRVPIEQAAEDLTDETFLRVWEHRERIPDEQTYSYILGIAEKVAGDHRRRLARERTEVTEMTTLELLAPVERDFTQRLADQIDMQRAFRRLKRSDKELLWRVICDGDSPEMIAAEERVAVDAIYQRLFRARKRLREQMKRNNTDNNRPIRVAGDGNALK